MKERTKKVLMARRYMAGYSAGLRAARRIVKDCGTDWESAVRCIKSRELRLMAHNAQPTKGVPA